jgi:AraC-like DNA-binding protein
MGFVTVLSRDPALRALVRGGGRAGASARSPERLSRLIRERPVTAVVVDSGALGPSNPADVVLREIARRFPSVGSVFVSRPSVSPVALLRLGRAGITGLEVLSAADLPLGLAGGLARATRDGTRARALRAVGTALDGWSRPVVGLALDGAVRGWDADQLAEAMGWTRAHLGVRLRERGLPPPGRLLLWARILHAARWIPEPGRTAESVSRQLDYANGATFRRALRSTLACTPTGLVSGGGFDVALRAFLDVCGVGDSLGHRRSVA